MSKWSRESWFADGCMSSFFFFSFLWYALFVRFLYTVELKGRFLIGKGTPLRCAGFRSVEVGVRKPSFLPQTRTASDRRKEVRIYAAELPFRFLCGERGWEKFSVV